MKGDITVFPIDLIEHFNDSQYLRSFVRALRSDERANAKLLVKVENRTIYEKKAESIISDCIMAASFVLNALEAENIKDRNRYFDVARKLQIKIIKSICEYL